MSDIASYAAKRRHRICAAGIFLAAVLVCVSFWRIAWGEWSIPLSRVVYILAGAKRGAEDVIPSADVLVVRSVRLPRLLAAVGAGGLLSSAGAVLQGVLSNPLAEPYTLGIAAGAALGASAALITDFAPPVQISAFLGSMAALVIVGLIARNAKGQLILAGVVANAVLSAGVTFLKSIAGDRLGAAVLWMMGSLSGAGMDSAAAVWLGAAAVLIPAFACAPMLDAMSLGTGRGALLGVDEDKVRNVLLVTTSAGVAAAVSSFGIIGFVGLVVPHLLRMYAGPAHRPLLILSFLAGGCLLAVADGAAQSLGELPVGVLTALTGGPFFCWLLIKK